MNFSTLEVAQANLEDLKADPRPGQGIVIGPNTSGDMLLQVSWLAGRDDDSIANRDPLNDTYGVENVDGHYVTANGDHVKGIITGMRAGQAFPQAFADAVRELDQPLSVPRIAGSLTTQGNPERETLGGYEFSIAREGSPARLYFADAFTVANSGLGRCANTYLEPGSLPSFGRRPYDVLPLGEGVADTAVMYWRNLNPATRVEVVVKGIDLATQTADSHTLGLLLQLMK
jgi:hypothetical protein